MILVNVIAVYGTMVLVLSVPAIRGMTGFIALAVLNPSYAMGVFLSVRLPGNVQLIRLISLRAKIQSSNGRRRALLAA